MTEIESVPAGIRDHNAKITIIGGGSPYCAGLMQSIAHMGTQLKGCHIVLMDINEESLELIYTLGSKLFRHAGVDLTLERTTNREVALADADFVLTAFRTGGMQARRLDEKLPLQHGLIGQETVGAGGFFYALRTVPVVVSIAIEMEKIAPHAFLLNYTNPSNIVTEAVAHASGIRIIGMCDGPLHEVQEMAQMAGVGAEQGRRLYHRTVGLNHGNWTTRGCVAQYRLLVRKLHRQPSRDDGKQLYPGDARDIDGALRRYSFALHALLLLFRPGTALPTK